MDRDRYQLFTAPPVVPDTMVLIDDVLQGLRNGRPTALRRLIATVDVSVPTVVIEETLEHLHDVQSNQG